MSMRAEWLAVWRSMRMLRKAMPLCTYKPPAHLSGIEGAAFSCVLVREGKDRLTYSMRTRLVSKQLFDWTMPK